MSSSSSSPASCLSASGASPSAAGGHRLLWLFGYGSLIHRAGFPFHARRPAFVRRWTRRFWQGSHDHRGTAAAPGRVVTLAPDHAARCDGVAYCITPEVFAYLDHREQNGYARVEIDLHFEDGAQARGVTYIAPAGNPAYLGPAPEEAMARQIAAAVGPSGANRDYLFELAAALRGLGWEDGHVFGLEERVRGMVG